MAFDLASAQPVAPQAPTAPAGGFDLSTAVPVQSSGGGIPTGRKRAWADVPVEAITNVVPSAIQMGTGIYEAVRHPIDTTKTVAELATGALLHAAPKEVVDWFNQYGDKEKVKKVMDMASSVGGMYKERYGSEEAIKKTIATDPVGFAGDLSTLISGGSTAATKLGMTGTATKLATAADIVNPIKGVTQLAKGAANVAGFVQDIRQVPVQKAANIARQAVGGSTDDVVNALRNAKPGTTTAQALADAGLNEPVAQALVKRAAAKDPKFFSDLLNTEDFVTANKLAQLAGGETATTTRVTLENMKNALNTMTTPQREAALGRANLGKAVADYEATAGKLSAEAASEVQKVRDLISAGNSAEAWARLQMIKQNKPVAAARYTYASELADKAFNEWSDKAAQASLDLGQGARFAKDAATTLRNYGIKPIEGAPLANKIMSIADDPAFAGNDILAGAVRNVADDIAKWTSSGGVVDAKALDAIRKNSVNAAIEKLRPGMDASSQKRLSAQVLSDIKPVLIDAIESSGGTGYRQYLADYTKGMQNIGQTKLGAEALKLYKQSPDQFVKLVQGNSPDVVEKIFGPGSYDIAVEMSNDAYKTMKSAAKQVETRADIAAQATAGEQALVDMLKGNIITMKLPNIFSVVATTTNKALDILERKLGKATMARLTEAAKDAKSFDELINTLPATERNPILKAMRDPETWTGVTKAAPVAGVVGKTTEKANALSNQQNQNALAK